MPPSPARASRLTIPGQVRPSSAGVRALPGHWPGLRPASGGPRPWPAASYIGPIANRPERVRLRI